MICLETLLPSCFVKYDRPMLRTITLFLALTATAFGQNSAKDEAQVWQLEKAYWEYITPCLSYHGSHGEWCATCRTDMHESAI